MASLHHPEYDTIINDINAYRKGKLDFEALTVKYSKMELLRVLEFITNEVSSVKHREDLKSIRSRFESIQ